MNMALSLFAVLIACMFLATMTAAIINTHSENNRALDKARRRARALRKNG